MSDSQQEHHPPEGKQKLNNQFFTDNPFKFEYRSERSASEQSDNQIAEIIATDQIVSDHLDESHKYKVMKIDIPEPSENSEEGRQEETIAEASPQKDNKIRSMEQIHQSSSSQQERKKTPEKGTEKGIKSPVQISYVNKIRAQNNLGKRLEEDLIENNELNFEEKPSKRKIQKIFQKYRSLTRKTRGKTSILDNLKKDSNDENQEKFRMQNKVNFQKKRENQSAIKNWNYQKIRKVEMHRKITEEINKSVDDIMKKSYDHLQIYRNFFQQRIIQEEKHANDKVINTANGLEHNQMARGVYMNCSSMLSFLTVKEKQEKARIKQLVELMKANIIKGIFDNYMSSVNKQLLSLRQRLSGLKQALKKIDEQVCNELIELERSFTLCTGDVNSEQSQDFYIKEISFLRQCESQINLQLRLGRLCFDYFKAAMDEEKKRSVILKQSLFTYMRCIKEFYKKAGREASLQFADESLTLDQLGKDQESYLIEEVFSLEQMLAPKTLKELNEHLLEQKCRVKSEEKIQFSDSSSLKSKGDDYISEDQLENFLTRIQFEEFDRRLLIARNFQVAIWKEQKWIPGEIVLTIDRYLHTFIHARLDMGGMLYGSQIYPKPELSLKISEIETSLLTREEEECGDLEIKITCREGTGKMLKFILGEKKSGEQIIKFGKEQDLLEFEDYLDEFS